MSTPTPRRLAWAYLNRVIEGPSRHLNALLAEHDVEEIAAGIERREEWIGPRLLAETASRADWKQPAEDIAAMARRGIRLITPDDPEWPREEFQQAFSFAERSHSDAIKSHQADAAPPHGLWVRGKPLAPLLAQAVTIVGTRTVSRYGRNVTALLASGLASHHWTVVSGGALGTDTVAHTEAMDAGGDTVMVASCGLDVAYPSANARLFQRIADHGCLVSEYPPGMHPARHRFLTRNRLVAAMGAGTVVTEAGWRSGALNTLSWAQAMGRVAMAVPGPVTSVTSVGCHERIKNQEAVLVTGVDDVRSLVSRVGTVDVTEQMELAFPATPQARLSRNEMRIWDGLHPSQPIGASEVATEAGLSMGLTVHLLVDLAKRGYVRREEDLWVRMGEEEVGNVVK